MSYSNRDHASSAKKIVAISAEALHNMTAAAKEALDAIQKRDELASPIQQEHMDTNEPALEEDHGVSSSSNVQELGILEVSSSP